MVSILSNHLCADCLASENTLRHLDWINLGVLNWTDSTTQGASAYIAPCRKIWSFWQRNNQDVRLFPWSGSLFSIQEEVFFSVTTQWLNACTWELASRNFLDGLSVTIKAFSQLCKAQNGNQEGPLLYRATHFWVILLIRDMVVDGVTDDLAVKPYIPHKSLLQWICCKCLAW